MRSKRAGTILILRKLYMRIRPSKDGWKDVSSPLVQFQTGFISECFVLSARMSLKGPRINARPPRNKQPAKKDEVTRAQ